MNAPSVNLGTWSLSSGIHTYSPHGPNLPQIPGGIRTWVRQLAAIAEAENRDADDVHVEEHEEEISSALGRYPARCWMSSVWWD